MSDNTLQAWVFPQEFYDDKGTWLLEMAGGREIVLLPANDDDPDELAGWQEQGRLWVEVSDE